MTTRSVLRHAFIILTVAFLLGLAIGPLKGDPQARLVFGSHVTGIVVGIWMITIALVLPHLRLGQNGARVLWICLVPGNYFGMATLGLFAPLVRFPSINTPELPMI